MGPPGQRNSPFYTSLCDPEIRFVSWLSNFFACIACEYSRVSLLLAARDVSPGGTSSTQRQKFHTDDVKSVRDLVRSSDWST